MIVTRRNDYGLESEVLDASGLVSPWPVHWARKRMDGLPPGRLLRIVSTDPGSVGEFQELLRTSARFELVRQEAGCDDRGRRTYIHFLRRKTLP